jgi:hypothetical protein
MACNLGVSYQLATNHAGGDRTCTPTLGGALTYLFNRQQLNSTSPVSMTPGAAVPFTFNGFDPNAPVKVRGHSAPIDLGTFTADAAGSISGTVTLPIDIEPGVHKIEFSGTNHGSPPAR